jgi:hypothetical protein
LVPNGLALIELARRSRPALALWHRREPCGTGLELAAGCPTRSPLSLCLDTIRILSAVFEDLWQVLNWNDGTFVA